MEDVDLLQEFKRVAMRMLTSDEITDGDFEDIIDIFVTMATSCVYRGNVKGSIALMGMAALVERERGRRERKKAVMN